MDNRRTFLKKTALLTGGLTLWETLPPAIQRALAINPAAGSTFLDAEYIVFLMQENRSFDHAYGTLRGVRGFNDPRAITLPGGNPVWLQTNAQGETHAPFHHDIKDTKATWMDSLPHSWNNQTDARNDGKYNRWLDVKKGAYPGLPMTMGYYTREDIPFYYSLADAFTVCDQHFCSSLTGTTPNRLHFWTGTLRGPEGAPARVRNEQTDYGAEANWTTFPERLEEAGISWKVYQNEISLDSGMKGEEDPWLTNFTDNPLEWFSQYKVRFSPTHLAYLRGLVDRAATAGASGAANATAAGATTASATPGSAAAGATQGSAAAKAKATLSAYDEQAWARLSDTEKRLHARAFTTNRDDPDYRSLTTLHYDDNGTAREVQVPKSDVFYQFRKDVDEGKLPAVSWLVAPEHYSDHPGSAWYGTWYVSEALDILTKNPDVWKKTIFILTYDENDGSFDHVPPFVAPHPHREDTGKVSAGIDTTPEYVTLEQDLLQTKPEEAREGPVGLGYRVPFVVASPWTRGGWVNSEVFDHTSSLQFLETFIQRKWGKTIKETNISEWRRTVTGDLSSIFRPYNGESISQPSFQDKDEVIEAIHKARFKGLPSPGSLPYTPYQEKGTKPSNALGYDLSAHGYVDKPSGEFLLELSASNKRFGAASLGAPFTVYAPGDYLQVPRHNGQATGHPVMAPVKCWSYAVKAGDRLTDRFPLVHFAGGAYHLRVYGPNGFFTECKGNAQDPDVRVSFSVTASATPALVFTASSAVSAHDITIVDNGYAQNNKTFRIFEDENTHAPSPFVLELDTTQGWYDVSVKIGGFDAFEARFAGRVETGKASISDPVMGGVAGA
ncbi:phosphocholine-specific phospholipase C [Dinghuibacter silviterrae]|uniref:phospholipase C n=1 Tax=Dinghuibacter silviterrae TaxID=1539049 RepID=A0A4R8DX11_9BACT|nr:phospholipase C, phosphocholine-specific [Dinghuibacter silviterrae]TDX01977.1 phospholipase C [Dinghuibacter silviterrae]